MRRRSAVEPVIGYLKNEHRMDRNYLHHRCGDATNVIPAAVGYKLQAPHQVAEDLIVPRPRRNLGAAKIGHSMKRRFFTDDDLKMLLEGAPFTGASVTPFLF